MKKPAILTIGVSGSGKTTFALNYIKEHPDFRIICRDDIRWEMMIKDGLEPCWKNWNWKLERKVTDIKNQMIVDYYNDHSVAGIIIADTNLNEHCLTVTKDGLEFVGYEIILEYFPITWEEVCKRNAARQHGIEISVLAKQYEIWNKLMIPQYTPDKHLPKAVIFDIDGVIAHHDGTTDQQKRSRGPFEWYKVDGDRVDEEIKAVIEGFDAAGYKIIFLTGRDGCCFTATYHWLWELFPDSDFELHMKQPGDRRSDVINKSEIFWNKLVTRYNIKLVFEDRPKMCRYWQSIGLKVIQIGNQNIEF